MKSKPSYKNVYQLTEQEDGKLVGTLTTNNSDTLWAFNNPALTHVVINREFLSRAQAANQITLGHNEGEPPFTNFVFLNGSKTALESW